MKLSRKWKAMFRESAARIGDRVVAMMAAKEMMERMLDANGQRHRVVVEENQDLQISSP